MANPNLGPTADDALNFLEHMLGSIGRCSGTCGHDLDQTVKLVDDPIGVIRDELVLLRGFAGVSDQPLVVEVNQPAVEAEVLGKVRAMCDQIDAEIKGRTGTLLSMRNARPAQVVATDRLTQEQAANLLANTAQPTGVAMDWDGTYKPLDQLSYVPRPDQPTLTVIDDVEAGLPPVEEAFAAKLAEYVQRQPLCEGGCGTPTAHLVQGETREEKAGLSLALKGRGLLVRRYHCPKCKRPAVAAVDLDDFPAAQA